MTRFIFSLGIFVGSFLLFLIQPMVGKILLPVFGGVPAVWTTCMLFFQAALLAGYLYAERSIGLLGFRKQSVTHLFLLLCGLFFLPLDIDLADARNAVHQPTFWLFSRLTASVGYLFFLIAANAPLLQRYYSYSGQNDASDPYFLYSASNAGSLLALVTYPFLFEPFLRVSQQKGFWS
ncbi:MAG TPA: spermidine synthase, partial [Candidatus Ozemobacteraceae bacterium]|nr:spermidine synthase [Candidatus Ozemobacteraceae bacterium]